MLGGMYGHVCIYVCGCAGLRMHMWKQKLTSGTFSIALHHIFLRLHLLLDIQLDCGPASPPDLPVSALPGAGVPGTCHYVLLFVGC